MGALRRWLQANCPRWANFQITNSGKYLGLIMGPHGGESQWKEPLQKFRQRVLEIKAEGLPLGLAASRFASRAIPILGFKAQLAPIPPLFTSLELWAAHKILGIPLSLDVNAAHGLEYFGGAKIVRASNYMRSCMLRAASKTLSGYEDMHSSLCDLAHGGGVSLQADYHNDIRPPGWQSDAFASHLLRASTGHVCGMSQHAPKIAKLFESIARGEGREGRKSQQGIFYSLLQSLSPPNWLGTLSRKLEPQKVTLTSDGVDLMAAELKKLGARISMCVLKTWANAWTTSTRMHESFQLPCIFGCPDCTDDLDHYLCCDPLWTAVISCSYGQSELLQAGPSTKLGLVESPRLWWQLIAIAFSCYHAVKMSHKDEILSSLASGHFCQVECRLLEYARVFSRELTKDG